MAQNTALASGVTSQVISNVPAAVLLSSFTTDWHGLLIGTNIGGLGTPIASLASLISMKAYLKSPAPGPAAICWCLPWPMWQPLPFWWAAWC